VIYLKIGPFKTFIRIWKRWFVDESMRKRFGFYKTFLHSFRKVKDLYLSDGIDLDADTAKHFKEKDRLMLVRHCAKELEEIWM